VYTSSVTVHKLNTKLLSTAVAAAGDAAAHLNVFVCTVACTQPLLLPAIAAAVSELADLHEQQACAAHTCGLCAHKAHSHSALLPRVVCNDITVSLHLQHCATTFRSTCVNAFTTDS
jgi:hypothetical protein